MKTLYLLAAFSCFTYFLAAQPVITSSIAPSPGDSWPITIMLEGENFDPGPGGENQVWDFSDLDLTNAFNLDIKIFDPADLTDGPSYEGVDFVWHLDGFDVYNYYQVTEDSLSTIAGASFDNGFTNFELIYSDADNALQFPLTYLDVYTYYAKFDQYAVGIYLGEGERHGSVIADGYGTIITPNGTFENVLRIVITETSLGQTSVQHAWLDVNNFVPVFVREVSSDPEEQASIYFSTPITPTTSTNDLPTIDEDWSVWYSAEAENIQVDLRKLTLEEDYLIQMYTLDGRLLKTVSQEAGMTGTILSLAAPGNTAEGSIIISLQTPKTQVSSKQVLIHRR